MSLDLLAIGRRRFEIIILNDEKPYLRGAVEFFDDESSDPISPEVRELEQEIGRKHRFVTTRHTFQIYGVCEECRRKKEHGNRIV